MNASDDGESDCALAGSGLVRPALMDLSPYQKRRVAQLVRDYRKARQEANREQLRRTAIQIWAACKDVRHAVIGLIRDDAGEG